MYNYYYNATLCCGANAVKFNIHNTQNDSKNLIKKIQLKIFLKLYAEYVNKLQSGERAILFWRCCYTSWFIKSVQLCIRKCNEIYFLYIHTGAKCNTHHTTVDDAHVARVISLGLYRTHIYVYT